MAKNVTIGNKTYIGINKIKVRIPNTETYHEFFLTDDATATENDIVSGKTAYANKQKITGVYSGETKPGWEDTVGYTVDVVDNGGSFYLEVILTDGSKPTGNFAGTSISNVYYVKLISFSYSESGNQSVEFSGVTQSQLEAGLVLSGDISLTITSEEIIPTLDTPVVSKLNNRTITWSAITGATHYEIWINGALANTISTTSYTYTGKPVVDVNVVATGSGYLDSSHSNSVSLGVPSFNLEFIDSSGDGARAWLNITYADGTTASVEEGYYQYVVSVNSHGGYDYYGSKTIYLPNSGTYVYSSFPYTLTEDTIINLYYVYDDYCFAKGTDITLADGTTKKVEDVTYEDNLLVWNFDEGKYDSAYPLWIQKKKTAHKYNHLVFSDGSVLNTINQHRIFNKDSGMFTYPMTDDTPIGTVTFNDKGEYITLVDKYVVEEEVEYYNIITTHHINLFANSILTSCRYNNIYPIENMRFVKEDRDMKTLEEVGVPEKYYYGLRLYEQPEILTSKNAIQFTTKEYIDRLEKRKL